MIRAYTNLQIADHAIFDESKFSHMVIDNIEYTFSSNVASTSNLILELENDSQNTLNFDLEA